MTISRGADQIISRRRFLAGAGGALALAMGAGLPSLALGRAGTASPEVLGQVKALAFDVFGTVVDWRGTLIAEGEALNREIGIQVDWAVFADAWRGEYGPSMTPIRDGKRPWVNLDVLHWENLQKVIDKLGIKGLREQDLQRLHRVWHRLEPWPDAAEGLTRLKRRYVIVTLSNGNVSMMIDIAKHGNLPWDSVLGAEVARQYKPKPEAYLTTVELLGLKPREVMMVAAHNGDLKAASEAGLRTAYVIRPTQYGPNQTQELAAEGDWDIVARNFLDLADQLGA
jgi:2-haloacid dehalogenase